MPVAENITPKIEEKTVPDTANPIKKVEENLLQIITSYQIPIGTML